MSNRTLPLDDRLHKYLLDVSLREPDILAELRAETSRYGMANMQIAPEQGQFMAMLVRLIGAQRYLEVGTFTGYSATVMALTMPDNAEIICCDVSEEFTNIARRYWEKAGVADRITLHLATAETTLKKLLAEGHGNSFDMMFIDADKENYDRYYELGLELVRSGGLMMIDNVLWDGAVADPTKDTEATEAIRAINTKISTDIRVHLSLVPIGDGLTLAQKK
jgi:predicted O-methyltransferase YrrM